jgi:glycine/D-amino acid oxidase-like deaminating enzyme
MADTVIVGAGIIGLSTAFYLSSQADSQNRTIALVDSSEELFKCASGLAGGFLAADCK